MKKIGLFLSIGMGILAFCSGCGSDFPDLTEEQSDMISEYAASLLLKYDSDYVNNLEDIKKEEEEPEKKPEEEPEEEPVNFPEDEESVSENELTEDPEEEKIPEVKTVQEFLDLPGLEFDFRGFSTAYSYSEQDDGEVSVCYEAADGNVLGILDLEVSNTSEEPVTLDMIGRNLHFVMKVGNSSQKIQPTMLLKDLSTFRGVLDAKESVPLVLIAEFEDGTVGLKDRVSLTVRNEKEKVCVLYEAFGPDEENR